MSSFGRLSFTKSTESSYLKSIYSLDKQAVVKAVLLEESSTNKLLRYYSLESVLSPGTAVRNQPFLDISDEDVRAGIMYLRSLLDVQFYEILSKSLTFCNTKFDIITMFAKANKGKRISYDFAWTKDNSNAEKIFSKISCNLPKALSNVSIETALNFMTSRIVRFYDYIYTLKKENQDFKYDDFDLSTFQLSKKSIYQFQKDEKCLETICSIISLTFDSTVSFGQYMMALQEKLSLYQARSDGVSNE